MIDNNEQFLTPIQAAAVIGVCDRRIRQLTEEGRLRSIPIDYGPNVMRVVCRSGAEAFAERRQARRAKKRAATATQRRKERPAANRTLSKTPSQPRKWCDDSVSK
jgi:hypothetical protein